MLIKTSRLAAALLALSVLAVAGLAHAAEAVRFEAGAFAEAKKAGRSILIDVHATWCSTCKTQKAVLAELLVKPEFKDMVVLDIDFDTQKDDWKALGAQNRSTLIVFKGETETGRSAGATSKDAIEALLKSAL